MKTKLLLMALLITCVGFSQTFDNIPTGTGIYINKLIASPSGSDQTKEYIEVRGTPNAVIPTNLYFISIEGDGNSSSVGQVEEAIQLGDGTRTFGANGILVITTSYRDTDDNSVTASPYVSLISIDATVIEIEIQGTDVGSSSSSTFSAAVPDIGYDGNLIDATGTYMIVAASSNPKDVYIDGTGSDDHDGVIDSTGDHTSWVLYDSVTYMDDNDEGQNEYGYGQIIFAQQNGTNSANQLTTTSATVVNFDSSSDANYLFRQGDKTGHTTNDWVAAGNGSGSVPNWEFSSTASKVTSAEFVGWDQMNTFYGKLNPVANGGVLSVDAFEEANFRMYPNPAQDFIQFSGDIAIDKVEVYNLLGKRVASSTSIENRRFDISSLSKGMYILRVQSEDSSTTRKFIKN